MRILVKENDQEQFMFSPAREAWEDVWVLNEFEIPDNYTKYSVVFEGSNSHPTGVPVSISKSNILSIIKENLLNHDSTLNRVVKALMIFP